MGGIARMAGANGTDNYAPRLLLASPDAIASFIEARFISSYHFAEHWLFQSQPSACYIGLSFSFPAKTLAPKHCQLDYIQPHGVVSGGGTQWSFQLNRASPYKESP